MQAFCTAGCTLCSCSLPHWPQHSPVSKQSEEFLHCWLAFRVRQACKLLSIMGCIDKPVTCVSTTGAMDGWPALTGWQDWGHLKARAGRRTVPVEVGQHYLAEQWGQRLMLFSDFLDQLTQPSGTPAYWLSTA